MPMDYAQYQAEVTADIAEVLAAGSCQPILFVGSGFTKRYTGGPNWEELLKQLAAACPLIDKDFAYYKQLYDGDFKRIGTVFTDAYREWAWGKGKSKFPPEYFDAAYAGDVFVKYMIGELLSKLGPSAKGSYGSPELDAEIAALKDMSPHAIITTNYDQVLEPLFPDYQPIIGQQILRLGFLAIGEIFKIHGCRSNPLPAEPLDGEPCFSVGWAVPEELRGQGRARGAFLAAVKELRHGFAPHGMTAFWIEGVVGIDNKSSQRVAEAVISAPAATATDRFAGVPVIQYLRRIDAQSQL